MTRIQVELTGWLRSGNELEDIEQMVGWSRSTRLGIKFQIVWCEKNLCDTFSPYLELEQQKATMKRGQEQAEVRAGTNCESQLQALRALLQNEINPEQHQLTEISLQVAEAVPLP